MKRLRKPLAAAGYMLVGGLVALLAAYIVTARGKSELAPWHRIDFEGQPRAAEIDSWTLADYLGREEELFADLEADLAGDASDAGPFGRFNPGSPTSPAGFVRDYNWSYEVEPAAERGAALLLHGLTDSPYSVRATAEVLAKKGYRCLALRLPGHGTAPGALRLVSRRDWSAAVRLGARELSEDLPNDQPLVLVGYSNGAALALEYTLDTLSDSELRHPDALVFLSPALAVNPVAALARWQNLLSKLPGLEKLAWNSVLPEVDPYKYNSFAINAGAQIHELTANVEARLARLASTGGTTALPPVLTLQSVVDSTVPPITSLSRLYDRLPANGSQLVLFDVNRAAEAESFLKPSVRDLLRRVESNQLLSFDATLLTNRDPTSLEVVAKTRRAGSHDVEIEELDLRWPVGVYSLSHVSIPFPPDDPIYGSGSGRFPFPFGRLEPRGERNALELPMTLLMRLRNNPFFAYQERRIADFVP